MPSIYIFIQLHIYGIYCNIQCNFFFPIIHKNNSFFSRKKFLFVKCSNVKLTKETQLPNFLLFSPELRMKEKIKIKVF